MTTLWLIKAHSITAKEWIDDHVDYTYKWCGMIPVETRYIGAIIQAMDEEGLEYGKDYEVSQ